MTKDHGGGDLLFATNSSAPRRGKGWRRKRGFEVEDGGKQTAMPIEGSISQYGSALLMSAGDDGVLPVNARGGDGSTLAADDVSVVDGSEWDTSCAYCGGAVSDHSGCPDASDMFGGAS